MSQAPKEKSASNLNPENKFKVQANRPASDLTPNEIVETFLGMDISQLIKDIQTNYGGKYDYLFADD